MRFGKLRVRNMGVFRGEHEFDIGGSVGPIVGVTGENGAGKTTMLGLLLGGIYRECPTRGSLLDLATARDSFVEVEVSNGSNYRFRQLCDAVSKKSETLITDAEGRPLVESGKVTEAKAFVAKHFPTLDLVLNSTFGAQKSAGFVGMKPAERKSLLLQLLGVERLELLAESARERAKGQKLKTETLEARMGDERARGGDVHALDQTLADARARVAACDETVTGARYGLDVAVDAAASIEAQAKEHAAWAAKRAELETALSAAQKSVADIETRVRNNRDIQAGADEIRAAVARFEAITAELGEAELQVATLQAQITAAVAADRVHGQRYNDARARIERAKAAVVKAPHVRDAVASLPGLEQAVALERAAVEATTAELEALSGRTLAGADERIVALRGGLTAIADESSDEKDIDTRALNIIACNALDADDETVAAATETPKLLSAARTRLATARQTLITAEKALTAVAALAAQAPAVEAAELDLESAHADLERINAESTESAKAAGVLNVAIDGHRRTADALRAEQARVRPTAAKAEPLSRAEARLAEFEPQLATARADVARLETQASATPAPPPPIVAPDVAAFRSTLERAEREARTAHASVAVAEQRVAAALESDRRLTELRGEVDAVSGEFADWNRLAADLGKDGLQAMVIDAAIPELNHTANELLWNAFGPRFTVDVRTQTSDAKGKRLLETLDVVVLDSELGREALAETLSGGELVIVSEALSLALTVLACRQSGVERPTIIRDESGSALSEGKAPQWIAMLRKAAEIINADRILFVSHTPATWELADSCIRIGAREAA